MPVPGGLNDSLQVVLNLPVEEFLRLVAFGNEKGRIARTAAGSNDLKVSFCDFFNHIDHFRDGEAVAGAEVEVIAFAAVQEVLNSLDVRISQVVDMHIVADACAVFSLIVGAENLNRIAFAESRVEYERDQMAFGKHGASPTSLSGSQPAALK